MCGWQRFAFCQCNRCAESLFYWEACHTVFKCSDIFVYLYFCCRFHILILPSSVLGSTFSKYAQVPLFLVCAEHVHNVGVNASALFWYTLFSFPLIKYHVNAVAALYEKCLEMQNSAIHGDRCIKCTYMLFFSFFFLFLPLNFKHKTCSVCWVSQQLDRLCISKLFPTTVRSLQKYASCFAKM